MTEKPEIEMLFVCDGCFKLCSAEGTMVTEKGSFLCTKCAIRHAEKKAKQEKKEGKSTCPAM